MQTGCYSVIRINSAAARNLLLIPTGSGEARVLSLRAGREITDTAALNKRGLFTATGTPNTNITRSQHSTLTRADASISPVTGTINLGNLKVWISIGDLRASEGQWRPPRPWASPYVLNSEQLDINDRGAPGTIGPWEYHFTEAVPSWLLAAGSRRPRRGWLWPYRQEENGQRPQISSAVNRRTENKWVGYVRTRELRSTRHKANISVLPVTAVAQAMLVW